MTTVCSLFYAQSKSVILALALFTMCGITGFSKTDAQSAHGLITRMTDLISHRGPDADGYYEDGHFALGHRRLSIIDLTSGQQPMSNEDGSVWVVYNGEIFNHSELRSALERAGHLFRTHCDTEVIVHAYEEYGIECVSRFRGMFSFALWDKTRLSLFCARDRLGKKPFYYFSNDRLFAFASEIKALFAHPEVSAEFDQGALPEYLSFGYLSQEQTLFKAIRKLMPGHYLQIRFVGGLLELTSQQYWDVPRPVSFGDCNERSLVHECRERLLDAVQTRLMSDVPLGVFLSGGVDSSTIAAVMSSFVSRPVKTFSVGYQETHYSELATAREVSRRLGTEHYEVIVGRQDFFRALPRFIWHEDEPITWPSSVPLGFLSELASRHVKVVLTGEGGDELFAGYGRYRHHLTNQNCLRWYRFLPSGVRRRLRLFVATSALLSADLRRKLGHTVLGRDTQLESLYLDNFYSAISESDREWLLGGDDGGRHEGFLSYWRLDPQPSLLSRMLYADQKTYLVELLMKQDQMSMSASIESRVPLLDHLLVEFAARCPDRWKLRGGIGKYLLRKVSEEFVPRDILYRRKMGFPTPIREWLLHPESRWVYEMLTANDGLLSTCLDREALANLIYRHRTAAEDATDMLWRLLSLQLWGDIFITGKGLSAVSEFAAVHQRR